MKSTIKKNRYLWFIAILLTMTSFNSLAQPSSYVPGKHPNDFPHLHFTRIPGAPQLGSPKLLEGSSGPIISGGMGWASPQLFDVNGDELPDLLLGEFGSGLELNGVSMGNFVRVYENIGTEESPVFDNDYYYLRTGIRAGSAPLSIYTWCCMPFTPRIVDLDDDGYMDILSGQFEPGLIAWYRGSDKGYLPLQYLEEPGDPNQSDNTLNKMKLALSDTLNANYWKYSASDFGDLDGDGLIDMIVAGNVGVRFSKNIGTATAPVFAQRTPIHDTDGNLIKFPNGSCQVPTLVDWDGDGQLDILLTGQYGQSDQHAILFFKGVPTHDERGFGFQPGIPLFTTGGHGKALPGTHPNITVADWNQDGIMDLVIGVVVPTLDGLFDHTLAYQWSTENDIYKENPKYLSRSKRRFIDKHLAQQREREKNYTPEMFKNPNAVTAARLEAHYYGKPDYRDKLAHQGYVYVLLGEGIYEN